MRKRVKGRWVSGFTLVETLAVVAILVILMGLSSVAVAYYRDYLKITELDNAAREIYMAAENRAVLLSNGRQLSALVKNDARAVALSAGSAEETGAVTAYYAAGTDDLKQLLPAGVVDPALRDGDFYIVYEPVSGCVTDVFYAESSLEEMIGGDFQKFYTDWAGRSRADRMRAPAMLGYYGGGVADGESARQLPRPDVTVLIHNGEQLTVEATFLIYRDALEVEGLTAAYSVELEYGGETPLQLMNYASRLLSKEERETPEGREEVYTWLLDSLEAGKQFSGLFSTAPGGDVRAAASITLSAPGGKSSQDTDEDEDNSLFAEGSGGTTARIGCLRHLQNLDTAFSGVAGKTAAVQTADILDFENETYPAYGFTPIVNRDLKSYHGAEYEIRGLHVTGGQSVDGRVAAGLFAAAEDGMAFTGVYLVNASVDAGPGAAGALAGIAGHGSRFTGCRVYWEEPEGGEKSLTDLLGSDAEGAGYRYQITGGVAGGLVGELRGGGGTEVKNCLAATLVSGKTVAGGLIGRVLEDLDTLSHSYADCYLAGNRAAGLIGDLGGGVWMEDCYTAGYIDMDRTRVAAGLCLGGGQAKSWTKDVYAAMRYPGGDASRKIYELTETQDIANSDEFNNTYFWGTGTAGSSGGALGVGKGYAGLTERTFAAALGGAFAWKDARNSNPYNLREHLNLVVYSFPGLRDLPHYGDWGAEFKEPSLVYYEQYPNSYGFSGGNARYLIGELSDSERILSDGYAVAFLKSDLEKGTAGVTVQCTWFDGAAMQQESPVTVPVEDLIVTTWKNQEGNEAEYCLVPLPEKLVTGLFASRDILQYLKFTLELGASGANSSGEYFYNPHFADKVIPIPQEEGKPPVQWDAASIAGYAAEIMEKSNNTLTVRTPRHLYSLGKYPEYCQSGIVFQQRLDLDYAAYTGHGLQQEDGFLVQAPVGSSQGPFQGVYDGGGHSVRGVAFRLPEKGGDPYAGLFGYSRGTLRNIVYETSPTQSRTVSLDGDDGPVYLGGLVGGSTGTVQNCEVKQAGFNGTVGGADLYAGGLAGWNGGTVQSCTAETPQLSFDVSNDGSAYLGGLVGGGTGTVRSCVARQPALSGTVSDASTYAGGLTGWNGGTVQSCLTEEPQLSFSASEYGSAYLGGMVSHNAGTVRNSAVKAADAAGYAYDAVLYLGGLAGWNDGIIQAGAAEAASLFANGSAYGRAYVGGLVGTNGANREISASYAVGRVSAETDKTSAAHVCGFAGENGGSIRSSYSAADLVSSGVGTETHGFCHRVGAGDQSGCYYLNEGNFTYRDQVFTANYPAESAGAEPKKYAELTREPSCVDGMVLIGAEGGFPYPTALQDDGGMPVHYGGYPAPLDLGEMGVYYWERLESEDGSSAGYYTSILAMDPNPGKKTVSKMNTLLYGHDDGAVVTAYGYGYYNRQDRNVILSAEGIGYKTNTGDSSPGTAFVQTIASDSDVDGALALLMPGFAFHSYHSFVPEANGGVPGLYPTGGGTAAPNGVLTLKQGGAENVEIAVTLNPHFADAMAVTLPAGWQTGGGAVRADTAPPGSAGNVYGVRSIAQLEFINWNRTNRDTDTVIDGNIARFPYLASSGITGKYHWKQSHDILGGEGRTYTPIAEYYDKTGASEGVLSGWFGGVYDGDDYVIENVNIQGQKSSCAGLFGIVYNGTLKNIILYSSDGKGEIASSTDSTTESRWYAMGGLAGLAASDSDSAIENCAVAGYHIKADVRMYSESGSWGGAEIGGLVGISNMNLQSCTAVTTITLPGSLRSKDNIRMGGLAGASQKSIRNSYAGGEIQIGRLESGGGNLGGNIYAGGIVGGSYFKPLVPSGGTRIGTVGSDSRGNTSDTTNNSIVNCYSSVVLPKKDADGYGKIQALYALGGTGEINTAAEARQNWDNKANHGVCEIQNSFYLKSESLKNSGTVTGIKTDLNDAGVKAVSFDQLAGGGTVTVNGRSRTVYQWLNAPDDFSVTDAAARLSGPFRPVTTLTDDGFSVSGKYSYPGAAAELQGMDYPFPTVLTRDRGTCCVHYGSWPLNGIVRDSGGAPIVADMFAASPYQETLRVADGIPTGGTWTVETGSEAIAEAAVGGTSGVLTVTPRGVGNTTVTVHYRAPGTGDTYSRFITVHVTAELTLLPKALTLFTNDTVTVEMEPRSLAGGADIPLAGTLEITGVSCDGGRITAQPVGAGAPAAVRFTGGGTPDSEGTMVNISYVYKDAGGEYTRAAAVQVTVAAVPELALDPESGLYTLTFGETVRIRSAAAENEPDAVIQTDKNRITLDQLRADMEEITLKITLTMDEQTHSLTLTARIPKDEEDGDGT